MKKFFKENLGWLLLTLLIFGAISTFIIDSEWIKKLILAPFAFLGAWFAFEGFVSITNKFVEDTNSRLKGGLCLLTFVISVIALAIWIIQW